MFPMLLCSVMKMVSRALHKRLKYGGIHRVVTQKKRLYVYIVGKHKRVENCPITLLHFPKKQTDKESWGDVYGDTKQWTFTDEKNSTERQWLQQTTKTGFLIHQRERFRQFIQNTPARSLQTTTELPTSFPLKRRGAHWAIIQMT